MRDRAAGGPDYVKSPCKVSSSLIVFTNTQTLLSEHQALRVSGSDSRSRPKFEIVLAYPGFGDDTLLVERGCLTPRLSDE